MPLNPDLFTAILAMDAYNRGYRAAINSLSQARGTRIGNAIIDLNADDANGVSRAAGFYAISYDLPALGRRVISYRGSDGRFDTPERDGFRDIQTGWSLFTGIGPTTQADLARRFYTQVTGDRFYTGGDPANDNGGVEQVA